MIYIRRFFCLALLTLTALLPAAAQSGFMSASPSPYDGSAMLSSPDESVLTIKKRVDEVNVLFIATDKHGKFVRNLAQTDFSILDDHKPPQLIFNFQRQTELPLEVGLLIDVSGSVHSRFDFEQNAATGFLEHVVRPGFDKAFVEGFNQHQQLVQDFTDKVSLLSSGVKRLHNGGGTALFDAIYRACRDKLMRDNSEHPVRKALIVLSDGEDNQSEMSEAQAIGMAERAGVLIYAISTDDSGLILRGDDVLSQLANATGGRAFFPFKMKDITHSFSAIEDELRSQYIVSYKPSDFTPDGHYRYIQITAKNKDVQVRARRGYYSPRQ
ncbi:MAG: VWA domain-containing protein [Acidobacteria bacterium]|nr:VWA domain-containing protein [Acidobacteriota bacterium]